MSKRAILHVGMHKTGSTSLQQTLGNSREILLKHNIYYPTIRPFNHSANFMPIVMSNPGEFQIFKQRGIYDEEQVIKERDRLKNLWIKEFRSFNKGNFIISGEELSKLKEADVINLQQLLKQYFDEIVVIIYVREPLSFIPSVISEYVKHGGKVIFKENYSKRFPFYRIRIQQYINVFGRENIIVRPFDRKHLINGDLFDDFFHSTDIKFDTSLLSRVVANESLSHDAVLFLLKYNNMYPRFLDGEINTERGLPFKLDVFYNIINKVKGEKFTLDVKLTKQDAEYLNEEIDFVNKLLPEEEQFGNVSASLNDIEPEAQNDASSDYYIKLINEFSRKIDELIDENNVLKQRFSKSMHKKL